MDYENIQYFKPLGNSRIARTNRNLQIPIKISYKVSFLYSLFLIGIIVYRSLVEWRALKRTKQ